MIGHLQNRYAPMGQGFRFTFPFCVLLAFEDIVMTEKTEWEIVDGPAADTARPTFSHILQTALGPWWRWKIAAGVVTVAVALVLLATVVGITLLATLAVTTLAVVVTRIRKWMHRDGTSGPLTRAD